MRFVRAEREADWPLHLEAFREMMPYYFAAGHVHYARYGLYYLRSMEALPQEVLEAFMRGEHVMRHMPGIWNGIWSDMYIETTFMRYGHGQNGIIGITLKPESLKTWAFSLHICSNLEASLDAMLDGGNGTATTQSKHKEEYRARIVLDNEDRSALRKKLDTCIDPFDPKKLPEGLVNIVSGQLSPPSANVHDAVEIGIKQMQAFEESWPGGFYDPIPMIA